MTKVKSLFSDSGIVLRQEIMVHYEKRLREKPRFWNRAEKEIKLDFSYIPEQDNRIAFWLIRKDLKLVIQCFVFCYNYSTEWQLITNKEVELRDFQGGIDVVNAEKHFRKTIDEFLEAECKNDKKDDLISYDMTPIKEVRYFRDLPQEEAENAVYIVREFADFRAAGKYIFHIEKGVKHWVFYGDI
ncbi:hypothetical protein [Helicobacter sp. MIT 05-5294]|uniref:hypothetical protein n=1 Tax=Helicobacter sp. MIT 05-5294 TaxID=1548150 RepID=UPI00051F93E9|nr:hypothetical protein [Helicobacter sp. MIT 05-5294]TLD85828.1 hypothetical protein LS69_007995 [Helicobacter sp. MIT 05-5294]